jgi:hypothetical protein
MIVVVLIYVIHHNSIRLLLGDQPGWAFGTHVENYKFGIKFFVGKPEGERPFALSKR